MPKNLPFAIKRADETNHQKSTVKGRVRIEVITAKQLIVRLMESDNLRRGGEVLQRNRSWLSYRVNRKSRILVLRTYSDLGLYCCASHMEFDHRINRN